MSKKFTVTVAALGTPGMMTELAKTALLGADKLFVQTMQTPCARVIEELGLAHIAMDDLYESCEDFDELAQQVAQRLVEAGNCVYAVPGRGAGEAQLQAIRHAVQAAGGTLRQLPGIGYAQAAAAQGDFPHADAMMVCSAMALAKDLDPYVPLAVEEIDCLTRAGEVKLKLSEFWPDEWPVTFCTMGEDGQYRTKQISLFELDRQKHYHATTVALLAPASLLQLSRYGYAQLEEVVDRLRAPDGCPWDREQTHESMKSALIEECYEVLDAIDHQDPDGLCEELGDVLLQCAMHAQIASEHAQFSGRDMTSGIVGKLIYRHPHVFGTEHLGTSADVLVRWEDLKKKEKHFTTQTDVLKAVPKGFPALMRSAKVQKKAAQVGFDWPSAEEAFYKIREETDEVEQAMKEQGNIREELGDLLFAVVNVIRLLKLDGEELLGAAADKFIARFEKMENLILSKGITMQEMGLEEMDRYWEAAKKL